MTRSRIGIFGGSFNPVHNGHLNICKAYLTSGFIDQLWVIPVFDPPHKHNESLIPFEHRLMMTRLAFSEFTKINVLDIEKHLPKPNYTLQTILYLQKQYVNSDFLLCIGGDSLVQFHTWFNYIDILKSVRILVVKRQNQDLSKVDPFILSQTLQIESKISPENATTIREEISKSGFSSDVPPLVMNYIKSNHLFTTVSD